MWLFSQPTATASTNNAGNAQVEDSNFNTANSRADEELCVPEEGSSSSSSDQMFSQSKENAKRRRKPGKGIIYFRPIKPEDRTVIETLHKQWFPVDYKSDFFDSLCNNRIMPGTNQPLYSCVACFKELDDVEFEEMYEKRERESCSMSLFWPKEKHSSTYRYYCNDTNEECILWEGHSDVEEEDNSYSTQSQNLNPIIDDGASKNDCCVSADNDVVLPSSSIHQQHEREKMKRFYSNGFRFDDCNGGFNPKPTVRNETNDKEQTKDNSAVIKQSNTDENCSFVNDCGEIIAGCIVGSFLSSAMVNVKTGARDETAEQLVPDPDEYPEMFYIMTLGTSMQFRRVGLGSILVNRVVDMIKSKQECGALYLHVITYNATAIKLYERLGFSHVKKIRGYYTINSVNYDCFLYARYFHGNLGHNNSDYLSNAARLILRKVSGGFIAG